MRCPVRLDHLPAVAAAVAKPVTFVALLFHNVNTSSSAIYHESRPTAAIEVEEAPCTTTLGLDDSGERIAGGRAAGTTFLDALGLLGGLRGRRGVGFRIHRNRVTARLQNEVPNGDHEAAEVAERLLRGDSDGRRQRGRSRRHDVHRRRGRGQRDGRGSRIGKLGGGRREVSRHGCFSLSRARRSPEVWMRLRWECRR